MNTQLENMLKNYPAMVRERDSLAHQIAHFKGLTAEEVIESMYTPRMDGERVQTSNISDKTAQIAMTYQEKMERINREWYEHLEKRLMYLTSEIRNFESALDTLPERQAAIMKDMIVGGVTWDALCVMHHLSRTMIAKYRRRAIARLSEIYDQNEKLAVDYLLS